MTISGLLTKRGDLHVEAERIRDRLVAIRHDVEAIDRILTGTLGYKGDLDVVGTRRKREVIFGRGELARAVLSELRAAQEPVTSREIAQAILVLRGDDARDRKAITDLTRRISKSLRPMRIDGLVRGAKDVRGNMMWSLARS